MLGAFGLALHHDTAGLVGDAHRRIGLVDVLAAGAAGAVGIGLEVRRVDIDLDIVIDLGGYKHRGKGCVTAIAGIEGRLADQPVHPGFSAQPAVGILALEMDGGALDTGHFPRRDLDQLGAEIVGLAPAQVHPQHHLGPVLGLRAAGAGLDVQVGVIDIHLAAEHAAEFQLLEQRHQAVDFLLHLGDRVGVVFGGGQLQQVSRVAGAGGELFDGADHALQRRALAPQFLGALRVVPDAGLRQLQFYLGEALLAEIKVKDTP